MAATPAVFFALGVSRLLVMAVPAAVIDSYTTAIHTFSQTLVALILVAVAAFHVVEPVAAVRSATTRALLAAGLGLAAGVAAAPVWSALFGGTAAGLQALAGGVALAGVVVAYAVNYPATTTARFGETIVWLSWYASWPVLAIAALGFASSLGAGLPDAGATTRAACSRSSCSRSSACTICTIRSNRACTSGRCDASYRLCSRC